jgi:hypothetical protein
LLSNAFGTLHGTLAALDGASHVILSCLVSVGVAATCLGLPLLLPRLVAIGVATALLGLVSPTRVLDRSGGGMLLDDLLPAFPVLEVHSVRVRVTPEGTRQAIQGGHFRFDVVAEGLRLITETRVSATGGRSRKLFAMYWRLILPRRGLRRRTRLAAIRRRAEDAA